MHIKLLPFHSLRDRREIKCSNLTSPCQLNQVNRDTVSQTYFHYVHFARHCLSLSLFRSLPPFNLLSKTHSTDELGHRRFLLFTSPRWLFDTDSSHSSSIAFLIGHRCHMFSNIFFIRKHWQELRRENMQRCRWYFCQVVWNELFVLSGFLCIAWISQICPYNSTTEQTRFLWNVFTSTRYFWL